MNTPDGSSPGYCAYLPGTVSAGNAESSNCSEEQIQNKWQTTPLHFSAVKFKIRSAKERQQTLKPDKSRRVTGYEPDNDAVEKVSEGRDQAPRVRSHSPPSPGPDVINGRSSRLPDQVGVTKAEQLFSSETSNVLRGPECTESMSTKERGRTEWRGAGLMNRSKSLDWRGAKGEGEDEYQTAVIRKTKDLAGYSARCSESFEMKKKTPKSPNSNELSSSSNSILLKIQACSAAGQGMQDSNRILPSAVPASSPAKMSQVALALEQTSAGQSLPSRLQLKQRPGSMEEGSSSWGYTGMSGPKPNQSEHSLGSRVEGSNINEVTGNQTILDRIGKLYGLNLTEQNRDSNSRDSVRAKRNSAPVGDWFYSSDYIDSNSNHRRPDIALTSGSSSSSYVSQWRKTSYDADKGGTFPRTFSKVERINKSSMPDSLSILYKNNEGENGLSNILVSPVIPWIEERKDVTCLTNQKSQWNENSQHGGPAGLETTSLDQARNAACDSSKPSNSVHCTTVPENSRKETERDRQMEKTHVKDGEMCQRKQLGLHGLQELHLFDKGMTAQARPQLFRSVTVDGIKHKEHEDVSELGSLSIPRKKRENLLEKFRAPSIDSVRSTIHKFEALAQQSQSPNVDLHPRRAFSVQEKPKLMTRINKSNSDKSLHVCTQTGNLFSKSEVSEEGSSTPNLRGCAQITETDKVRSTMKTQSIAGYTQEHGHDHTIKLLDIGRSDQSINVNDTSKDDFKTSMFNRYLDESDVFKLRHGIIKNMDSMEEQLRNDRCASSSKSSSNESNRSNYVSHLSLSDFSIYTPENKCSLDGKDATHTECLDRIPLKASKTTGDKAFKSSEHALVQPDSSSSTSVKSALLRAYSPHSKSLSIPLGSPEAHPVKIIPAADFTDTGNRIRNEKIEVKISRWITDEGDGVIYNDDEDNYEEEETEGGYDSDSGSSSVTITSNMSQSDHRSFSLSFVDLCNLGGLDCLTSAGSGSKDEDRWMSKRSASLSSDASILSCITLLGTEELDCLLEDVRGLGDDTLENYEEVHVVVLHKEVGSGLGFTVAGGVDQNKPVTVHRVFPCGAAAHEGSIHEGDQVLSINGTALHNSTHWEALRTLRKARGRSMAVVVLRKGNVIETQHSTKDSLLKSAGKPGSSVCVTLTKSIFDLGFSLEGGVGSSLGDKPLTVQRIFQGGPIGKVFPGDELLEVQGQSLVGLRRLEAWKLIKRLPPGSVEVLLHRPLQPHSYPTLDHNADK